LIRHVASDSQFDALGDLMPVSLQLLGAGAGAWRGGAIGRASADWRAAVRVEKGGGGRQPLVEEIPLDADFIVQRPDGIGAGDQTRKGVVAGARNIRVREIGSGRLMRHAESGIDAAFLDGLVNQT